MQQQNTKNMVTDKFKYTLEEANERLKQLAPFVTPEMKSEYHLISGTTGVTQWKWLKKGVPSIVAANHFVLWIEDYCKKNNIAA